jgi:hypothetical protein
LNTRQADGEALGIVSSDHLLVHIGEEFTVPIPDIARVVARDRVGKGIDKMPVFVMVV